MKFRLFLLLTPLLAALYHFSARDTGRFYVVQRCQHFPGIQHSTLYDFVTQVHLANKWMKFVTFVATDQRAIVRGKIYKAVIEPHIFLLTVVEHWPGHYIALESTEAGAADGLQVCILLRFASPALCSSPAAQEHHHPPECKEQFTNRISSNATPFPAEAKFAPLANGTGRYSPGVAEEVQHCNDAGCQRRCQHPTDAAPDGSSLSVQIFFQHKSILFQYTMGPVLRYLMQRHLKQSLNNLVHILPHIERYGAMPRHC